jgi:hypothetical protein
MGKNILYQNNHSDWLLANRMTPNWGLSNYQQSEVKRNKNWLTYAFTLDADGSNKLPPFIIRKAAQLQGFFFKTGT